VISTLWAKTLAAVKAEFADWYCLIFESVTKNGGRIEDYGYALRNAKAPENLPFELPL